MGTIADTAGSGFAYKAQSAWIDVNASGWETSLPTGNWQAMRLNSDGIAPQIDTKESAEITADREPRGARTTGQRISGPITHEFTAGTYDDWLSYAMQAAAPVTVAAATGQTIGATIISNTKGTATITDEATASAFASVVAGMWLYFTGFTNTGNNGFAYVQSKTSSSVIVCSGHTWTTETGDTTVGFQAVNYWRIGSTKTFVAAERQWDTNGSGTTDLFQVLVNLLVASMEQTIRADDFVMGTITVEGAKQDTVGTSEAGTVVAANNTKICSAVDEIEGVYWGLTDSDTNMGLVSDADMTEISWRIDNKVGASKAIAKISPVGIRSGVAGVTGTISCFLSASDTDSVKEIVIAEDHGTSSLAFRINDDTYSYLVTFHQILYTACSSPLSGASADGVASFSWSAQQDDVLGVSMTICKITLP